MGGEIKRPRLKMRVGIKLIRPKPEAGAGVCRYEQAKVSDGMAFRCRFQGQHLDAATIGLYFFPGLFALTIVPHSAQAPHATRGKARIIDGYTFEVDGTQMRLAGIDR